MELSLFATQALFLVLALVVSALVAVVAGVLRHATGTGVADSVLYGGGAFVLWMTLSVTVLAVLGLLGGAGSSGP